MQRDGAIQTTSVAYFTLWQQCVIRVLMVGVALWKWWRAWLTREGEDFVAVSRHPSSESTLVELNNESLCQLIAPFHLEFSFPDVRDAPDVGQLAHAVMQECPPLGYAWHLSGGRVYLRASTATKILVSHRTADAYCPWPWPAYGDSNSVRSTRRLAMWWRMANALSTPPVRIVRTDHGCGSNLIVQANHAATDGALLMGVLTRAMKRLATQPMSVHISPRLSSPYAHRIIVDQADAIVSAGARSASHAAVAVVWKSMVQYYHLSDETSTLRLIVSTRGSDTHPGTRLTSVAFLRMSGARVSSVSAEELQRAITEKMSTGLFATESQRRAQMEAHSACPMEPTTAWVHNLKTRGSGASPHNLHVNFVCDMRAPQPFAGGAYVAPTMCDSVALRELPLTQGTDSWMLRLFEANGESGVFRGDLVIM